jgi:hypothetical protein
VVEVNTVEKELLVDKVLDRCGIRNQQEEKVLRVLKELGYWEVIESLIEALEALKVRGVSINDPVYSRGSSILLKVLNKIY